MGRKCPKWMDGWMNGRRNERMNEWTDKGRNVGRGSMRWSSVSAATHDWRLTLTDASSMLSSLLKPDPPSLLPFHSFFLVHPSYTTLRSHSLFLSFFLTLSPSSFLLLSTPSAPTYVSNCYTDVLFLLSVPFFISLFKSYQNVFNLYLFSLFYN